MALMASVAHPLAASWSVEGDSASYIPTKSRTTAWSTEARKVASAIDTLDRLDKLLVITREAASAEAKYIHVRHEPGRVRVMCHHPARVLQLLYQDRQVILTSATLSVGDDFRSVQIAFGIHDLHPASCIIEPRRHGSAFFILADRSVPAPRATASPQERIEWLDYAAAGIQQAVGSGGTTLVLTASYADTEDLSRRLIDTSGLVVHRRGERLKSVLEKLQPGGTLISPAAWAGVDGTFDNIVIPRLPFPAPDEEAVEAFGTDPSCAFLNARAEVARRVRQAIGRGLRSQQQVCDVWILDPRFPLPPTGSRNHRAIRPKAGHALTFKLDLSKGADQCDLPEIGGYLGNVG